MIVDIDVGKHLSSPDNNNRKKKASGFDAIVALCRLYWRYQENLNLVPSLLSKCSIARPFKS